MSESSSKSESRARRELSLAEELYDVALEGIAELLALRQTSNEIGRRLREQWADRDEPRWRSRSALGDLAFDLAELQVKTLRDMTQIGKSYADFFWKRLNAARGERETRTEGGLRPSLLHLRREREGYAGTFRVTNATGRTARVGLPPVLVFRRSDEREHCFVKPHYDLGKAELAHDESTSVTINVRRESVEDKEGTFLCETSVTLGEGRTLPLYLELEVTHGDR
jgi:hypothetical protein